MARHYSLTSATHCMNEGMAYRLWENGLTDEEIGNACCVSAATVSRWRRKNGFEVNKPNKKKEAKPSKLAQVAAEARAHGMTYGQWVAARGTASDKDSN